MKTWLQEQAEHHRKLITDKAYWLCEHLADLEAHMQPSLNQEEKEQVIEKVIYAIEESPKEEIDQIKARLNYLTKKYIELEKQKTKQAKEEKF